MDKLIEQIYTQWKSVKKRVEQECENRALFNIAEKYRVCSMFKGSENIEQIVRLFLSPQGVEFCQENNFPDIQTLRQFRRYDVERFGVFIDAGSITLNNVRRVMLIGNTEATITCDNKWRYEIILMHGAKLQVKASGWAVVFITNKSGCEVTTLVKDRAKVL